MLPGTSTTPEFKSVMEAVPSANPIELAPPIQDHVRAINALSAKLKRAEEKAGQYKISIGQHIKAIKEVSPDDWENIVMSECNLGRSRAYELMAIADGTKTVEQIRAGTAQRMKQLRSRRPSRDRQNADTPETSATIETEPEITEPEITDAELTAALDRLGPERLARCLPPAWDMSLTRNGGASIDEIARLHKRIAALEAENHEKDLTIERLKRRLGDGLDIPPFQDRKNGPSAAPSIPKFE